jgi:hypothetical protein
VTDNAGHTHHTPADELIAALRALVGALENEMGRQTIEWTPITLAHARLRFAEAALAAHQPVRVVGVVDDVHRDEGYPSASIRLADDTKLSGLLGARVLVEVL